MACTEPAAPRPVPGKGRADADLGTDTSTAATPTAAPARWEHFRHSADIGIRGIGPDKAQAFEQAALALAAVVCEPGVVLGQTCLPIHLPPAPDDFLLLDWINALIYEMSTRNMLFSRFEVTLDQQGLQAQAWGEPVQVVRHRPAVEPKGATFTELSVQQTAGGAWVAQCIVDV